MPYIKQENRKKFSEELRNLAIQIEGPGELNYVITSLCKGYLYQNNLMQYKILNELIGVLECVKMEFYRKICSPYEDLKERENGEV